MDVREAIEAVIKECPDEYAKAYAEASRGMIGHELNVQILYILSNTQYWRGERARSVKNVLKEFNSAKANS